jgi:ribonuclease HII
VTLYPLKESVCADVFMNDCDEDVCMSWALIHNHVWSQGVVNPSWNRLVAMEDILDATAGAYPFPKALACVHGRSHDMPESVSGDRMALSADLQAKIEAADWVIGCDETGYGAWAGPMAVGMVAVPRGWTPPVKIGDSKKLSATARERAYEVLQQDTRILHGICETPVSVIDRDGVYPTLITMHTETVRRATVSLLAKAPGANVLAIVDGNLVIPGAVSLPKADSLVAAVSAASILAKVWRDREMARLDAIHPGYDFKNHVGYGTAAHMKAIEKLGVSPLHRKSYAPIARYLEAEGARHLLETLAKTRCV